MKIEKLNAYIHSAIPYAWDDSMSWFEFLGKVLAKVNEIIDATNEYFSVDIFNHVNEILTQWKKDGTLAELLDIETLSGLDKKANKKDLPIYVKWFGIEGGEENVSIPVNNLLKNLPDHSKVIFDADRYVLNMEIDKPVEIEFGKNTTLSSPTGYVISAKGTEETESYILQSDAKRGDNFITLATAHNLLKDDYIIIQDDSARSDGFDGINCEVHKIDHVDDLKIYVNTMIRIDKKVSDFWNVKKFVPIKNVHIGGFRLKGDPSITINNGGGVLFEYVVDSSVGDIESTHSNLPPIYINKSVNINCGNLKCSDSITLNQGGYGYGFTCGYSQNVHVNQVIGKNMRHTFDLASCFDIYCNSIIDYKSKYIPVVLGHNSFISDVTINSIKLYNIENDGIRVGSQGIREPYETIANNIFISNVEIYAKNANTNLFGIHIQTGANNFVINNLVIDGVKSYVTGVRLTPYHSDFSVNHYTGLNLKSAILLNEKETPTVPNEPNPKISPKFNNCRFENVGTVLDIPYGFHGIQIENTSIKDCTRFFLSYRGAFTKYLFLNNVFIDGLEEIANLPLNYMFGSVSKGSVNNITNNNPTPINVVNSSRLTSMNMFSNNKNNIIELISDDDVTLNNTMPFETGFIVGIKYTILNAGEYNINIPTTQYFQSITASPVILTPNSNINIFWDGLKWVQI